MNIRPVRSPDAAARARRRTADSGHRSSAQAGPNTARFRMPRASVPRNAFPATAHQPRARPARGDSRGQLTHRRGPRTPARPPPLPTARPASLSMVLIPFLSFPFPFHIFRCCPPLRCFHSFTPFLPFQGVRPPFTLAHTTGLPPSLRQRPAGFCSYATRHHPLTSGGPCPRAPCCSTPVQAHATGAGASCDLDPDGRLALAEQELRGRGWPSGAVPKGGRGTAYGNERI